MSITERSVGIRIYPITQIIAARNDLQKRSYQETSNEKKLVNKIKSKFLEELLKAQSEGNYI